MAIYKVNLPKRDFAIGDTWAPKLTNPSAPLAQPEPCIVCGTPQNSCKGDEHGGTAGTEVDSRAA